jgi:hypothetical protein
MTLDEGRPSLQVMQRRVTFVVRVTVDESDRASAVIEVVRTGRKEPVPDLAALGEVVARLLGPGGTAVPPSADADPR